jgi:hypothetical protein
MTTTIKPGHDIVTLINVFTVEPNNQQQLVDLLIEATEKTIRHLPGFISANIHQSLDGSRVVNYAQWQRREDFEAMPHLKAASEMGKAAPRLYDVAHVNNVEE